MYEIYDSHAGRYDELVQHEDHRHNLCDFLRGQVVTAGMTVVEAGIGTGRVARCYADLVTRILGYDRSTHMLERAAVNLAPWSGKLALAAAEHLSLPAPDSCADLFIEGWAFGHRVIDEPDGLRNVVARLVEESERVTRVGAPIVMIESLGTNTDAPEAPHPLLEEFYTLLESSYGFHRSVISTDYRFESLADAERICGFFFGNAMSAGIRTRFLNVVPGGLGEVVVPEFTGIWIRRNNNSQR